MRLFLKKGGFGLVGLCVGYEKARFPYSPENKTKKVKSNKSEMVSSFSVGRKEKY